MTLALDSIWSRLTFQLIKRLIKALQLSINPLLRSRGGGTLLSVDLGARNAADENTGRHDGASCEYVLKYKLCLINTSKHIF